MRQIIYYPALDTIARYENGIVQSVLHKTKPRKETSPFLISLAKKVYVELPNNLKQSRIWRNK